MLNKEALLTSDANKHHVRINFEFRGQSFTKYFKGYIGKEDIVEDFKIGSIDRVPYWLESGKRLHLISLFYHRINDSRYTKSKLSEVPSNPFYLKITLKGISSMFVHKGYAATNTSDTYKFDAAQFSETLGVTFDPPPDGYLDPNTMQPI